MATFSIACVSPLAGQILLEFAGARFLFDGPPALLQHLQHVPCAVRVPEGSLAEASLPYCQVTALEGATEHPPPSRRRPRLEWAWHDSVATLRSRHATAELHCGGGAPRASARFTPNRRGAESLLLALSAASLHGRGGVMLHAAALELGGSVIALIGPSGAGKSTTCRQQAGARLYSVDRLAVAPSREGWLAFPMPGGTRSAQDLPPSPLQRAPLRAILCVQKAASGCAIESCTPLQGVAALRQSAFHPGLAVDAELQLLAHLQRLVREVPVAHLQTGLGTLLAEPLGRWLSRRFPAGAEGNPFHE